MKPIQKWAHAQRLIDAAFVKLENIQSWYFSPFELKSKISETRKMQMVIKRLMNYSQNQLDKI